MFCSVFFFFFSSRRRHTRFDCDWSSDVCSSDLGVALPGPPRGRRARRRVAERSGGNQRPRTSRSSAASFARWRGAPRPVVRSEEHTSELQSQSNLVCRLLLEKKKIKNKITKTFH